MLPAAADYLADDHVAVDRQPAGALDRHDPDQLAFERAGRGGHARRLDQARGRGFKPRALHLVDPARQRRRGGVHRFAQIGREVADICHSVVRGECLILLGLKCRPLGAPCWNRNCNFKTGG